MKANHRHLAIKGEARIRSFSGPVSKAENPRAHGGVCYVDTCRCGATRARNVNGNQVEKGDWVGPPRCPLCGDLRLAWQVYCGAACSARAEMGR